MKNEKSLIPCPSPAPPNLPKGRRSRPDGYSLPLGGAGGGWVTTPLPHREG